MRALIVILLVILLTILANIISLPAIAGDAYGQDISPDVEKQLEQAKNLRLPNLATYDNNKAIDILKRIQDENPDYYRAAFNLGLAYWNDKDYKDAKSQFDQAIEIKKKFNLNDVTVFNSAGWVSMRAGDYTAAENYFKEGLKEATAPDSKGPMDLIFTLIWERYTTLLSALTMPKSISPSLEILTTRRMQARHWS